MLPSGPAGGGVRKSGVYPRGGSNAIAPTSASPSSRPLSDRSHGTCNAAYDGSRRTTSERTSSHIGEIANLVRTRSSTVNTNRTTRRSLRVCHPVAHPVTFAGLASDAAWMLRRADEGHSYWWSG